MSKLKLTKAGLPGYEVAQSHNDVNGMWGGYKTWIVHYANDYDDRLALYTYLGWYWDVGRPPLRESHSQHEVASLFNELLRDGIPTDLMYWIVKVITAAWKIVRRNGR